MSAAMSAFARYAQEAPSDSPSSPAQTSSVLPASRKRKRASMTNVSNGHEKETQKKKNRSKSLLPLLPIAQNNGEVQTKPQPTPSTTKKSKAVEKKFLSPAYPTPFPARRVIVSEPRLSATEENDQEDEV